MESWLERGGIGVLFALCMTVGITLFLLLTSGVSAESFTFRDVVGQPWYRNSLDRMSEMEVVRGYEDGTFRPDQYVNRAEIVTLLSRYHAYLLNEYFPQHSSSDDRFLQTMLSANTTTTPEQKKLTAVASNFVDQQIAARHSAGSGAPTPVTTEQKGSQTSTTKAASCAN
jgi:hypothetical protein